MDKLLQFLPKFFFPFPGMQAQAAAPAPKPAGATNPAAPATAPTEKKGRGILDLFRAQRELNEKREATKKAEEEKKNKAKPAAVPSTPTPAPTTNTTTRPPAVPGPQPQPPAQPPKPTPPPKPAAQPQPEGPQRSPPALANAPQISFPPMSADPAAEARAENLQERNARRDERKALYEARTLVKKTPAKTTPPVPAKTPSRVWEIYDKPNYGVNLENIQMESTLVLNLGGPENTLTLDAAAMRPDDPLRFQVRDSVAVITGKTGKTLTHEATPLHSRIRIIDNHVYLQFLAVDPNTKNWKDRKKLVFITLKVSPENEIPGILTDEIAKKSKPAIHIGQCEWELAFDEKGEVVDQAIADQFLFDLSMLNNPVESVIGVKPTKDSLLGRVSQFSAGRDVYWQGEKYDHPFVVMSKKGIPFMHIPGIMDRVNIEGIYLDFLNFAAPSGPAVAGPPRTINTFIRPMDPEVDARLKELGLGSKAFSPQELSHFLLLIQTVFARFVKQSDSTVIFNPITVDKKITQTGVDIVGSLSGSSRSQHKRASREACREALGYDPQLPPNETTLPYFFEAPVGDQPAGSSLPPPNVLVRRWGVTSDPKTTGALPALNIKARNLAIGSLTYLPGFVEAGGVMTDIQMRTLDLSQLNDLEMKTLGLDPEKVKKLPEDEKKGSVTLVEAKSGLRLDFQFELTTKSVRGGSGIVRYLDYIDRAQAYVDRGETPPASVRVPEALKDKGDKTKAFFSEDTRIKITNLTYQLPLGLGKGQLPTFEYDTKFAALELDAKDGPGKLTPEKLVELLFQGVVGQDLLVRVAEGIQFEGQGGFAKGSRFQVQNPNWNFFAEALNRVGLASQGANLKVTAARPTGFATDQPLADFSFEYATYDSAGQVVPYEGTIKLPDLKGGLTVITSTEKAGDKAPDAKKVFSGGRLNGETFLVQVTYKKKSDPEEKRQKVELSLKDSALGVRYADGRIAVEPELGAMIKALLQQGNTPPFSVEGSIRNRGTNAPLVFDTNTGKFETDADYVIVLPAKDKTPERTFTAKIVSKGEIQAKDNRLGFEGELVDFKFDGGDEKKGFSLDAHGSGAKLDLQGIKELLKAIDEKNPELLKNTKGTLRIWVKDKTIILKVWDKDPKHPLAVNVNLAGSEHLATIQGTNGTLVTSFATEKKPVLSGGLQYGTTKDGKPLFDFGFTNISETLPSFIFNPSNRVLSMSGPLDSVTRADFTQRSDTAGPITGHLDLPGRVEFDNLTIDGVPAFLSEGLGTISLNGTIKTSGEAHLKTQDAQGQRFKFDLDSGFSGEIQDFGLTLKKLARDGFMVVPTRDAEGKVIDGLALELRAKKIVGESKNVRALGFFANGEQSVWIELHLPEGGLSIQNLVASPDQVNAKTALASKNLEIVFLQGSPTTNNELDTSKPHDIVRLKIEESQAGPETPTDDKTPSVILDLGSKGKGVEVAYTHGGDAWGVAEQLVRFDYVDQAQIVLKALNEIYHDGKWDKAKLKGGYKFVVRGKENPGKIYNIYAAVSGALPPTAVTGNAPIELPAGGHAVTAGMQLTGNTLEGQFNPRPGIFVETINENEAFNFTVGLLGKEYVNILSKNKVRIQVTDDWKIRLPLGKENVASFYNVKVTQDTTPVLNGLAIRLAKPQTPQETEKAPTFDELSDADQQRILAQAQNLKPEDRQKAHEVGLYRNYLDGITRVLEGPAFLKATLGKKAADPSWESLSVIQEAEAPTFKRLTTEEKRLEVRNYVPLFKNSGYVPGGAEAKNLDALTQVFFKQAKFSDLNAAQKTAIRKNYQLFESAAPKIYDVRHDAGEDHLVELVYGDAAARKKFGASGIEVWDELSEAQKKDVRAEMKAARELPYADLIRVWDCATANQIVVDANATPVLSALAKAMFGAETKRYYEIPPAQRQKIVEKMKALRATGKPLPQAKAQKPEMKLVELGYDTDPMPFGLHAKLISVDAARIDIEIDPSQLKGQNQDSSIRHPDHPDISLATQKTQIALKMVFYQGMDTAEVPVVESLSTLQGGAVSELTIRVGVDAFGNPSSEGFMEMRYGKLVETKNPKQHKPGNLIADSRWEIDWNNPPAYFDAFPLRSPARKKGEKGHDVKKIGAFQRFFEGKPLVYGFGMTMHRGQEMKIFTSGRIKGGLPQIFDLPNWIHLKKNKYTDFNSFGFLDKLPLLNEKHKRLEISEESIGLGFGDAFAFTGVNPPIALAHKNIYGVISFVDPDTNKPVHLRIEQGIVINPEDPKDRRSTMDQFGSVKFRYKDENYAFQFNPDGSEDPITKAAGLKFTPFAPAPASAVK